MLGDAVYKKFNENYEVKATDIDLNESWLTFGDVRDYEGIRKSIVDFQPDLIINLAALTSLEYCEQNQEEAWLTNALGPENVGLSQMNLTFRSSTSALQEFMMENKNITMILTVQIPWGYMLSQNITENSSPRIMSRSIIYSGLDG